MSTQKTLSPAKLEPKNAFVLSRNPERALNEMMEAITVLRAVYAEENTALLAADTKKFLSLQDRKIQAAANYQAGAQQLIARRDEFKNVKAELRNHLLAMQNEFYQITAINLTALDRVNKSVKRLGARIMLAARNAVQKESVNYGKSGNLTKIERAVSLGLNQSA